jgi:3-oxoacyl-[acyl-carrier protein] reductase
MKYVVVTGGSRGIGRGIATALIQAGYHVIIISRNMPEPGLADAFVKGLWDHIKWDLSDTSSFPELAREIRDVFGTIYGLVNNAGIGTSGILSTMADLEITRLIQMNTLAPILLTKHLIKSMLVAREGRVINMSSIVASTGYPGLAVYSATKAALVGFTHSLAREVGSLGITVNAVAPGFIETEMTHDLNPKQREQIARRSALQRMASINDVGAAVEFLMSDKAKNITGTVMTVDAGNTA